MSKQATVEVTIDEEGVATIHVVGGKGPGCKKHVDAFKAMGKTLEEGKKPEYFEQPAKVLNTLKNG